MYIGNSEQGNGVVRMNGYIMDENLKVRRFAGNYKAKPRIAHLHAYLELLQTTKSSRPSYIFLIVKDAFVYNLLQEAFKPRDKELQHVLNLIRTHEVYVPLVRYHSYSTHYSDVPTKIAEFRNLLSFPSIKEAIKHFQKKTMAVVTLVDKEESLNSCVDDRSYSVESFLSKYKSM